MAMRVEPERRVTGPPGDQGARRPTIAAVAMVDFMIDGSGACRRMSLRGLHRDTAGEFALVAASERSLSDLQRRDGRLVTCDGAVDLTLLRLAALRHRHFRPDGAASWLRDLRDAHDDVVEMLDPTTRARSQARRFAVTAAGPRPRGSRIAAPALRAQARAQVAVVNTVVTYLHLVSEQRSDAAPLATGVGALADLISHRIAFSPHLAAVLDGALFAALAPHPF